MNNSAARLCMPHMPEEDFLKGVKTMVRWMRTGCPTRSARRCTCAPSCSATTRRWAFTRCTHALFAVICGPVGSYYKEGINPVGIMIEDKDVRAVRGGTGYAKCGGNYAASNRAGERAEKQGYSQVLWLDGVERKYIEEVGAMNVMFKIGGVVVTPALTGSILPGVTRKSCIEVLKQAGYPVEERLSSVDELERAMDEGTLEEALGLRHGGGRIADRQAGL